jgi:hypothetical protein
MKSCGCDFCNDWRNVEPAKYIGSNSKALQEWLEKADEEKKFVLLCANGFAIVDKCPKCGYEFTEEDYDSY